MNSYINTTRCLLFRYKYICRWKTGLH